MTVSLSVDWFLYDRDLHHEELTKLNSKFTESPNKKRKKRIISHVDEILISHVYISIFMGV